MASKTGGIPEELAYGGGIMVPPNDKEALATALLRLLEDDSYRERLERRRCKQVATISYGEMSAISTNFSSPV